MKKKIYTASIFICFVMALSAVIFMHCPFGVEPDPTLFPLNAKDSLAVRAILDSNGLSNIDLGFYKHRNRVLTIIDSFIVFLKLDTFNLQKFRFISEFKLLDDLKDIGLTHNKIKSIYVADTITFKYPMYMNLSFNELDSFPIQLLKINNVEALYMNNNNLIDLPLEIMGKPYMYFRIRYNKLKNVPDTLNNWLSQYDPDWEKYQDTSTVGGNL